MKINFAMAMQAMMLGGEVVPIRRDGNAGTDISYVMSQDNKLYVLTPDGSMSQVKDFYEWLNYAIGTAFELKHTAALRKHPALMGMGGFLGDAVDTEGWFWVLDDYIKNAERIDTKGRLLSFADEVLQALFPLPVAVDPPKINSVELPVGATSGVEIAKYLQTAGETVTVSGQPVPDGISIELPEPLGKVKKRILAYLIEQRMVHKEITLSKLIKLSGEARETVCRVLDPEDDTVSIDHIEAVMEALGIDLDLNSDGSEINFSYRRSR